MVTDEMVEKASVSMCLKGGFDPFEAMPNDGPRWKYYVDGARAALESALSAAETEKPAAEDYRHPEWIWYCESTKGPMVTFGRWAKNPQQKRYKLADIQPTEHDHPAPSVVVKASPEALEQFTAYFVKNYPGPDTVIFDPKWHAPKIFRAAIAALSAQVQDVADSPSIKAIAAERARQIEVEGWTPEHDDAHAKGELLLAAKAYFAHATDRALSLPDGERAGIPFAWPWDKKWWKPKTPRKDLIRAGALALAEIERIKRLYHVRAEHRYIDAEAHYRLIVAELERLDSAAAPAKQEDGHD